MTHLQPVLRVKHSKKQVAEEIAEHFNFKFSRYVDAAVTDAVVYTTQPRSPKRSVLNTVDQTTELILTVLQESPDELVTAAQHLWEDLSKEEYESIAASDPSPDPVEAAAHYLYLNQLTQPGTRTYDANHKAEKFPWDDIRLWSERLDGVKILSNQPFEMFDQARASDLVFLDTSSGIDLEPALEVAHDSPGQAAILTTGDTAVQPPDSFRQLVLSKCRPGSRTPDVLYLKSE